MEDKFSAFSKRDIAYSSINGHDIFATVLTPTKLQDQPSAPRPVLVHWHGGGFVVGHRTYGPWWPLWSVPLVRKQLRTPGVGGRDQRLTSAHRTLELALSRSAIVISPDYRLLPEASGVDILTDVEAFWTWMQRELPLIAARESWPAYPDLSRVVVLGESSGGYLAVQSALLCSTKINIKAVISISAPLDGSATMRTMVPGPRMVMGARPPPPRQAQTLIRDYIRHGEPGVVRTEGDPLEMWTLLLSLLRACDSARVPKPCWLA